MKNWKRVLAMLLLATVMQLCAVPVHAQQTLGVRARLSTEMAAAGETVTLAVGLEGQSDPSDTFTALQLDIGNVDAGVLVPESYLSLISDDTAKANTASYQSERRLLRLVYFREDRPTQHLDNQDVLQAVLRMDANLMGEGSITLLITLKVQMASGARITQTGEAVIRYTNQKKPVNSLDIQWGAMEYAYSDGVWNAQTHTYEGTGWADNGTGFVTVKNSGEPVQAAFAYTPVQSQVSGSFRQGENTLSGALLIGRGKSETVRLMLDGKPAGKLDHTKLGMVTVRMGGE